MCTRASDERSFISYGLFLTSFFFDLITLSLDFSSLFFYSLRVVTFSHLFARILLTVRTTSWNILLTHDGVKSMETRVHRTHRGVWKTCLFLQTSYPLVLHCLDSVLTACWLITRTLSSGIFHRYVSYNIYATGTRLHA